MVIRREGADAIAICECWTHECRVFFFLSSMFCFCPPVCIMHVPPTIIHSIKGSFYPKLAFIQLEIVQSVFRAKVNISLRWRHSFALNLLQHIFLKFLFLTSSITYTCGIVSFYKPISNSPTFVSSQTLVSPFIGLPVLRSSRIISRRVPLDLHCHTLQTFPFTILA